MKDSVLGFGFRYFIALLLGIMALSPSALSQELKPLVFDTPEITLVGEDARAQLLVHTPASTDGAVIDLTRNVRFEPSAPNLIAIDAAGLITPMATGELNLTAHADGYAPAILPIRVELSGVEEPVNFPNQIVPIFTKFGCNGGGCHGKIAGQNGFRLSLLGSEPA